MLLLSLIIVAALVIAWFVVKDMNKPLAEKISTTVHKVEDKIQAVADVNKDGKVDTADAKVVATKVKAAAKKATTKKPSKKKDA